MVHFSARYRNTFFPDWWNLKSNHHREYKCISSNHPLGEMVICPQIIARYDPPPLTERSGFYDYPVGAPKILVTNNELWIPHPPPIISSPIGKHGFYKIGHISANNGTIWKIQNLASSGQRPASAHFDNSVTPDAAREMTSRARVMLLT